MGTNVNEVGGYLIHLLKSVLNNQKAVEKPEGITFEELFAFARFHSTAAMACYGVERLDIKPEETLLREWKKYRDFNMVKSLQQISERDRILDSLIGKGIDVLPLKGSLLIEMYPQSDYREMADLDILIDASKAEASRKIMEELGYVTTHFNVGNHDNYEKPPYMGVELHRFMIPERYETHDYYRDVWEKAVPDERRPGSYRFSWDDYYIFMLVHFAKHYFSSGSGIRTIMDIHVFLQKHGQNLHPEYLRQEFEKLNLWQFAEDAVELSDVWFGKGYENERTAQMAQYIWTSGVYGTWTRRIENEIRELEKKGDFVVLSRLNYFAKRCFLNRKGMYSYYPILQKFPVLLPLCWIHRWFFAILKKRDRIMGELREIIR